MPLHPTVQSLYDREADFALVVFLAAHPQYADAASPETFVAMHDLLVGTPTPEDVAKAMEIVGSRSLVSDYLALRAAGRHALVGGKDKPTLASPHARR